MVASTMAFAGDGPDADFGGTRVADSASAAPALLADVELRAGLHADSAPDLPAGYDGWRAAVDGAAARRREGTTIAAAGGGIMLATGIIGAAMAVSKATSCSNSMLSSAFANPGIQPTSCIGSSVSGPMTLIAVGELVGLSVTVIGDVHRQHATDDLRALYQDGGVKGYLTVAPLPGGLGANCALRF
jgi:hypothetical protein